MFYNSLPGDSNFRNIFVCMIRNKMYNMITIKILTEDFVFVVGVKINFNFQLFTEKIAI